MLEKEKRRKRRVERMRRVGENKDAVQLRTMKTKQIGQNNRQESSLFSLSHTLMPSSFVAYQPALLARPSLSYSRERPIKT